MNTRTWWATSRRVLAHLLADKRTIGLMMAAPPLLLTLLYYMYSEVPVLPGSHSLFSGIALTMFAVLPMFFMFLITSITMQRERASGTLERLWTTNLHRADLLFGYSSAFVVMAVIQATILCTVGYCFLGVQTEGDPGWVVLNAAACAVVGVSLGLMTSAFARSEFQAVQFMPIVVLPQVFLCGLLVPLEHLPRILERIALLLPLTYGVKAIEAVKTQTEVSADYWESLAIVLAWGIGSLVLAALTMPRRSA